MEDTSNKLRFYLTKEELDALDDVLDVVCNTIGTSMLDCYFKGIPQKELFSLHGKVMRKLELLYTEDQRENLRVIENRDRMRKTSSVRSSGIHKTLQR